MPVAPSPVGWISMLARKSGTSDWATSLTPSFRMRVLPLGEYASSVASARSLSSALASLSSLKVLNSTVAAPLPATGVPRTTTVPLWFVFVRTRRTFVLMGC
jgi:hypothetical protein